MTGSEKGYLLLTSSLGDPERKTLTPAQLRSLGNRVRAGEKADPHRELEVEDLTALGYGADMAARIHGLLQQEDVLAYYLQRAGRGGILPLSQISADYPRSISEKLGPDGPGSLWCKGNTDLLKEKMVSLVGSRDLQADNHHFAREAGRQAALQGYVLVSGNARGADQAAQKACLEAGGQVICVVADDLTSKRPEENVLYLSEDGFDCPFTAQRALSRNRIIHALPELTFVAQCGYQLGGTWSGTVKNLRFGWSPVFCYADGTPASKLLEDLGAQSIEITQLSDFSLLHPSEIPLI